MFVECLKNYVMSVNRMGTMGRIRMLLIDARHPEAVSLLRAARYNIKSCRVVSLIMHASVIIIVTVV